MSLSHLTESLISPLTSPLLQSLDLINHGFFTRLGGVSTGQFESLNCSQFSSDTLKSIQTNRRRVKHHLAADSLFSLKQIHSNNVVVIDGKSDHEKVVEADALVTCTANLALGVMGADCAGVLFADAVNRVIGAAHGGWQGALGGVTDNVVAAMCALGAHKEHIAVAIGPAIQRQSYEVGDEFATRFLKQSEIACHDCFSLGKNGQGICFDLPRYLEHRLLNAAVGQVDRLTEDTYADEKQFFSHRRSRQRGGQCYGRQINAICLK